VYVFGRSKYDDSSVACLSENMHFTFLPQYIIFSVQFDSDYKIAGMCHSILFAETTGTVTFQGSSFH
jgi:hypothetical protein